MRIVRVISLALLVGLCFSTTGGATDDRVVRVGSKNFTEGYLLSELLSQLLESDGFTVERRFGLGGTLVCHEALVRGEIDVYPEYTGTLEQAILKLDQSVAFDELRQLLAAGQGLTLLQPLGFNNTYAIALTRTRAAQLGLTTIGDLAAHPGLRIAFSHEFLNRQDGWPGLAATYGLPQQPNGIEHGLAYQAMAGGKIDVTDVYSTDGDIARYDLVLLDDDRGYFPTYLAAPLVRTAVDADVKSTLDRLAGRIDETSMRAMNASVLLDGKSFAEAAANFLGTVEISGRRRDDGRSVGSVVAAHASASATHRNSADRRHVHRDTGRRDGLSNPPAIAIVIYGAGALQTIPSIALLAFMIPLFGIGVVPAIVALFLYALLPVLRNTAAALVSIDPVLKRVAAGMGLTRWQQLRHVELPLAAPTILAGVKTAAVINIGTATLAAFIGAGGLGEPIVTGLALNDTGLIMEGAVPAAALAILTEFVFEAIERVALPKHLLSDQSAS